MQPKRNILFNALLSVAGVSFAFPSHAQVSAVAEPGRIDQQLDAPSLPNIQSDQKRSSQKAPYLDAPEGAKSIKFTLNDISISGGTLYAQTRLKRLYNDIIRQEVSIADIYDLAHQINQLYYDDGYIFTRVVVPPQTIEDGVARLEIIEGYVGDVVLEGNNQDYSIVKNMIADLEAGDLLNIHELEKRVLLLNDLPGITIRSVVEPLEEPARLPGALRLKLLFEEDKAPEFKIGFDNHGSRFVGPFQAEGAVTLNNVFGHVGETQIRSFQATQRSELQYYSLSHKIPIHASGTTLAFAGSYATLEPGGSLDENDVRSFSRRFYGEVAQPILRSRSKNLTAALRFERNASDTSVLGTRLFEDVLHVLDASLIYDFADQWHGFNFMSLNLRRGLDIFDTRETGSLDLSRAEGRSDFTTLQAQILRSQAIGNNWSVFGFLKGQYAATPLLSAEEFGYGGNEIGKAYNASEIVGDHGVSGLVELRYNYDLENARLQPYGFYDFGKVWNIDQIDSEDFSGTSAGFGLRSNWNNGLATDITAAFPLTRTVETPQYGSGDGAQIKFSLTYKFQPSITRFKKRPM